MIDVRDIMRTHVITSKGEIPIREAVKILYEKHIGSIVIVDNDNRPKGIFTERERARTLLEQGNTTHPSRR
jgi:CBS domain-containing protein